MYGTKYEARGDEETERIVMVLMNYMDYMELKFDNSRCTGT